GSPPPEASKKVVPKLRSVISMVIAAASTGSASTSRNAVTSTDHTNSGILCSVMPGARMLKMVVMKLIELMIEAAPARCSAKIAKSGAGPVEPVVDGGAYAVQPMPAPVAVTPATTVENIRLMNAATVGQKAMMFIRGKAMSGAPIIS